MSENNLEIIENLSEVKERILSEINKVIIGQNKILDQFLIALFSNGHCLLEGVPGLAKTLLISSMAQVLDMKFNRIQFTPDLMHSDIQRTDMRA